MRDMQRDKRIGEIANELFIKGSLQLCGSHRKEKGKAWESFHQC